jgi:UDP-hydrolysing UDP-N-acetyl-D-glucosamine 2-epimerase
MSKTVGLGVIEISTIFDAIKPDYVLTVADRFETLATAVAASYANIPLIHLQGGETTGSIDDKVRNAVTQLADYHFPMMRMDGGTNIYPVGCPSLDLLCYNACKGTPWIEGIVNNTGTGDVLDFDKPYIIVMFHSDTNDVLGSYEYCLNLLRAANRFKEQKIIFWNNIDSGGEYISKILRITSTGNFWEAPVRYVRQIPPEDFGLLLSWASCIVGNSSSGIREASFVGCPSVNVGKRQIGREQAGNVVTVLENTPDDIYLAIKKQLGKDYKPSYLYGNGHAGEAIAKTLSSIIK